jgi:large subunit ribosomal protein L31e
MGHSQNSRKSTNKPKKGALDTVQNESIDKEPTETTEETEEDVAEEEGLEEQPVEEAATTEEAEVEAEATEEKAEIEKPKEETAEAPAPTEEAEEAEEEEKEKEKPKKAPEEEIVEERIYTIPLRRAWIAPRKKRTPRAMRLIKSFVQRHMKIETRVKGEEEEEEERLVISNEVNEKLWNRGIEKPPRNIRVRAVKDKEGVITLYLAEGD